MTTLTVSNRIRRSIARAALAGALVATLGASHAALAADASKEDKMPKTYSALMKMKPVEVMHMMDNGKKGFVTREEFMKFYEELFNRMDKDKNGKITEPEFTDHG
jgi:hypothetical protein